MQFQPKFGATGLAWIAPVVFGVLLIVLGVLIFVVPKMLEFVVAVVLIGAGCSLVALGWNWRTRVSFRRMDQSGPWSDDSGGQ